MSDRAWYVVRGAWVVACASILISATAPRRLSAQADPRLIAAVRLAQEGQGDSARAAVKRIIDATPVANPLYAEALYTSALVAGNTAEMEPQLQRLVVEYNGSPWADDALLRLAQLNFARGDLPGVARNVERLASDYPQSEVIPEAATWAARAYFRQQNTEAGCRWLADGLAKVDTVNVELKNELVFLDGRCVAAGDTTRSRPNPPADSGRAPPRDTTPAAPAPQRPSVFAVQVASSSTQANADALIARLTRDGFRGGYSVTDGSTIKVRVGRFATRAEADALAGRMRAKYPSVFVVGVTP